MITFPLEECKGFSQKIYDDAVDRLQLHMMECNKCKKKGFLKLFGSYKRTLKLCSEALRLRIQRVRCTECDGTHALLPSLIVAYSQIPKPDQQEILKKQQAGESVEPVLERNNLIDENHVKYIIRQFRKHWEQRIASLGLTLADSLTPPCLSHYARQFMQIHSGLNSFFPAAT